MKLSKMATDQVADALLIITPEIEILMNDTELHQIYNNRQKSEDIETAKKLGFSLFVQMATYLLKKHRKTTWNILGAINQSSHEEIGKQPFLKTLQQVIEIFNDKDLMSFFTSFAPSEPGEQSDI